MNDESERTMKFLKKQSAMQGNDVQACNPFDAWIYILQIERFPPMIFFLYYVLHGMESTLFGVKSALWSRSVLVGISK